MQYKFKINYENNGRRYINDREYLIEQGILNERKEKRINSKKKQNMGGLRYTKIRSKHSHKNSPKIKKKNFNCSWSKIINKKVFETTLKIKCCLNRIWKRKFKSNKLCGERLRNSYNKIR